MYIIYISNFNCCCICLIVFFFFCLTYFEHAELYYKRSKINAQIDCLIILVNNQAAFAAMQTFLHVYKLYLGCLHLGEGRLAPFEKHSSNCTVKRGRGGAAAGRLRRPWASCSALAVATVPRCSRDFSGTERQESVDCPRLKLQRHDGELVQRQRAEGHFGWEGDVKTWNEE